MLSEKKIRENNGDYFGELSKSLSDMYNSFQINEPKKSIQEQVDNFAKSTTDVLGDTFNLSPDPFANPNPIPNGSNSILNNPISNNFSLAPTQGLPMVPSQGFGMESAQSLPQQPSPIFPAQTPSIFPDQNVIEEASKSIMNIVDEPVKTFSGVFSAESAKSEIFKAPSESSFIENVITILLLIIFLILIGIYAIQYFYGIDIVAKIKNIFTNHPEVEINIEKEDDKNKKEPKKEDAIDNDVTQILKSPQVFNVPENNYIYGDAQAVCKAYGARLATYQEVEEAYDKGAEWCNYGWSDGQMALFPTQQKTFDKLQKIEGHKNDCGRPGVNGGFIDNPKLKYGVNCYGYKPRINKIEKEMMETSSIYPKTEKDIAMDKRVEYWKERLSEIIVSPFSHDKWSKI